MPITALDLLKRSEAGAALTAPQHDENLTKTEAAVNALITLVQLALTDDGKLKDGKIEAAAQVADAIITLAKLAALDEASRGAFLRANASTGAIEAAHVTGAKSTITTAVASTGAQSGLSLGTFLFEDLPAGNVMIWVKLHGRRNAGLNGGTVTLKQGETIIDQTPTHNFDNGTQWTQLVLFGRIENFEGGDLSLELEFETSEATSDLVFGVDGENRFGRSIQLLAGL